MCVCVCPLSKQDIAALVLGVRIWPYFHIPCMCVVMYTMLLMCLPLYTVGMQLALTHSIATDLAGLCLYAAMCYCACGSLPC